MIKTMIKVNPTMKRLFLLAIVTLLSSTCYPQFYGKKIKCKNQDYVHKKTGVTFPVELDRFSRGSLYAFDRKKENIGINYSDDSLKTTVYVYPVQDGYEDRLRRSFLNCLMSIVVSEKSEGKGFEIEYTSFRSGNRRIHGYRSFFPYQGKKSLISLYECGHWWLKFRLTNEYFGEDSLIAIEERMRAKVDAAKLIESNPLGHKVSIYFQKTAFRDSLMLGCVMGGAFEKAKWLDENIDSLEMEAGIPSVYLEYYEAGFNGMLKFADENPDLSSTPQTKAMIESLRAVANAGYLREFISHNRTVTAQSDTVTLNMDGFYEWVSEHPMNDELFKDYAIVGNK